MKAWFVMVGTVAREAGHRWRWALPGGLHCEKLSVHPGKMAASPQLAEFLL